jgi:hypothetical protein
MRLQEDIDFTTLTWVKAELDETLKQARHALEAYVEDPADVPARCGSAPRICIRCKARCAWWSCTAPRW